VGEILLLIKSYSRARTVP